MLQCANVKRWKQEKLKLGKNKSEESVSIVDIVMLKREHKNDVAQFGLVIEIHSQNKNIVIKLQSGYHGRKRSASSVRTSRRERTKRKDGTSRPGIYSLRECWN